MSAVESDVRSRPAPMPEPRRVRALFVRSVWLPAIVSAVLLLIALGMLLSMSWHSLERLRPVEQHRALVSRIENAGLSLEQALVENIGNRKPISEKTVRQLRRQIAAVGSMDAYLAPRTPARMQRIETLLSHTKLSPHAKAIEALGLMRSILLAEVHAHDRLVSRVYRNTELEFHVVLVVIIALPLLAILTIFFLRHRILQPLNNLRSLMTMLAQQNYSAAPVDGVEPMLRPLFDNYNQLVGRLARLEEARNARQQSLEKEVRSASQALLEQQRNLASAERLAAVGEIAAGIAHELRNPLAAIQMTLTNLRREITDSEQVERIDLIIAELKRLARLLNDVLNDAHQAPEPMKVVSLAKVVEELLALARYQLPEHVRAECSISPDLLCRLPEDRLRQALLNLILNSAQAMDRTPGTVAIDACRENRRLHLEIHDDGPGFPQDLIDTGIRPFVTGREHGTGLGLATVRRFVADLGGELRITNRTPNGACIIMDLPCGELQNG
ncbi:MAG: ATP-binding protein [Pseudomonadota bacterium]|nr:ATP-binding protein [Pseudomonadota bacterium]